MIRILVYPLIILLIVACSPISKQKLTKTFLKTEHKFKDHTGFVVYDLKKRKTVYSFNGEKYFIPASNTKIFTLFTALTLLGDSIPGLYYNLKGDSLIFWGTGDPSFLYDQVMSNSRVYSFLQQCKGELYFSADNFNTTALGPGWAWNDYNYAYSSERSPFPVYGNTYKVTQSPGGHIQVSPTYFKKYFWLADSMVQANVIREPGTNRTDYYPARVPTESKHWYIPYKTNPLVVAGLLEDTLKRKVNLLMRPIMYKDKKTLFSIPTDSVYKAMMQPSDNFIAEQLLLMCGGVIADTLKPEIAIRFMKENHFKDLPDDPVWVDGSGLSRFNLFTPQSIVKLWEKIYDKVSRDRLFPLLAIGGKTGTIKNLYRNDPPFIYGKTGTLRNNHTLSGYLVTKKGDTLIFSFMNNNFTVPVNEVRAEMERILRLIYDNY